MGDLLITCCICKKDWDSDSEEYGHPICPHCTHECNEEQTCCRMEFVDEEEECEV